jgi:hypothetical protein
MIGSMVVSTEELMDLNIIKGTVERKGNNGVERISRCAVKNLCLHNNNVVLNLKMLNQTVDNDSMRNGKKTN